MERGRISKEDMGYIKSLASIFSQKWTFEIVFSLANGNEDMGFNELLRSLNGISAAVLSKRLKILQSWGYVAREVRTGPPTRTRYSLSEKGRGLIKVADFVLQHRGKTTYSTESLSGVNL
ncbi:MAG: helix-turn-helix domain-containing protein [Candidatus Micrarchaeota archaeon]|nr:helix-turn-helix domain-containing protein [Candidatus Micrarchaeota archaeon]